MSSKNRTKFGLQCTLSLLVGLLALVFFTRLPSKELNPEQHPDLFKQFAITVKQCKNRYNNHLDLARPSKHRTLLILILALSGDIETNPGPKISNKQVWPCAICEHPYFVISHYVTILSTTH